MDYLLDTHVLLWTLVSKKKLSKAVKNILLNPESNIFISTISLGEISLKFQLGKLKLRGKSPDEIPDIVTNLGFNFLILDPIASSNFYKLPKFRNKDPFDRMLAWQAISEDFTLISKDKGFDSYQKAGLKRVW